MRSISWYRSRKKRVKKKYVLLHKGFYPKWAGKQNYAVISPKEQRYVLKLLN